MPNRQALIAYPSGKSQRAVSANALAEHSDNETEILRIFTKYKF